MPRREFKGAAIPTRLVTGIGTSETSFSINNNSGWPTGGANGTFYVTLDPGTADEERVLVTTQAGGLCTGVARAQDNTSAKSHPAGADGTVIHSSAAVDYDEANRHIFDTTIDQHTQYMMASGTRHDLTARHPAGTVIPTTTAGAAAVGGSAAEGSGVNLARATHTHGFATGAPVSIGTANAAGVSGSFPRLDHVHEIGAGAIDAAALFAAGVVDSNALGALAVIAGKIATGGVSATAQLANNIVSMAKMLAEDPVSYAPTAASFSSNNDMTVGTGGTTYGFYYKFGLLTFGWTGFSMAADGNFPSGGTLVIPLPVTVKNLGSGYRGFGAARARRSSDSFIASGTGVAVIGSTRVTNIATAGSSAEWDATTPFNWGTPGDGSALLDSVWFVVASA